MAQQRLVDQGLLIMETSLSHSDTPQSVDLPGELLTPHGEIYLTTHNSHTRQTSMLRVGFEPAIPATWRPQTHALYRAATGIGNSNCTF